MAKDIAHKGGKETDYWNLLINIYKKLQKARSAKLLVWHQYKSQEKKATVKGFDVQSARISIKPILGEAVKSVNLVNTLG